VPENGFIFLLSLGATLLTGILAVAHFSAYRLNQRREQKLKEVLAPDIGSILEPQLDLVGDDQKPHISIQVRHAENVR
jgi:hypothetical protein